MLYGTWQNHCRAVCKISMWLGRNRSTWYERLSFIEIFAFWMSFVQIHSSTQPPGPWFNIKMSYQYKKSHFGDKTVVRSSYLHNRISYTGKMTYLYWISPEDPNKAGRVPTPNLWMFYLCFHATLCRSDAIQYGFWDLVTFRDTASIIEANKWTNNTSATAFAATKKQTWIILQGELPLP